MPNPKYDYRGPAEGALQFIKRITAGTRSEDEIKHFLAEALAAPGTTRRITGLTGTRAVEIVAVSTEHGMRFEVVRV